MQPEKINKGIGTPQPRVLDMGRNNNSSPRGTTNQIFLRKSQATRLRNFGYSHTLKRALDGVCAHQTSGLHFVLPQPPYLDAHCLLGLPVGVDALQHVELVERLPVPERYRRACCVYPLFPEQPRVSKKKQRHEQLVVYVCLRAGMA